jgi:U3 small nucleolar RNA-associated protein 5
VTRLSGLHTTITSRLSLQERLLTLNGRLDLVLSQIELRSSEAPALVSGVRAVTGKSQIGAHVGGDRKQKGKGAVAVKYVEGESETDGDDDAGATSAREGDEMDVDVDSGEDEGSVEDVELGGNSESDNQSGSGDGDDDEEDERDDSDDTDQEGSDDDGAPKVNGFLDAEAAETWSEDESEESEEE